jgi:hypothetical protein
MRENYWAALKVNWIIWIPAQIINFAFIPPVHAVMFANSIALFWNGYLSWSAHKGGSHGDGDEEVAAVDAATTATTAAIEK